MGRTIHYRTTRDFSEGEWQQIVVPAAWCCIHQGFVAGIKVKPYQDTIIGPAVIRFVGDPGCEPFTLPQFTNDYGRDFVRAYTKTEFMPYEAIIINFLNILHETIPGIFEEYEPMVLDTFRCDFIPSEAYEEAAKYFLTQPLYKRWKFDPLPDLLDFIKDHRCNYLGPRQSVPDGETPEETLRIIEDLARGFEQYRKEANVHSRL